MPVDVGERPGRRAPPSEQGRKDSGGASSAVVGLGAVLPQRQAQVGGSVTGSTQVGTWARSTICLCKIDRN